MKLDPAAPIIATVERIEHFTDGDFLAIAPGRSGKSSILGNDERIVLQALARPATRSELDQRIADLGFETGDPEHLDEIVERLETAGLVTSVADVGAAAGATSRRAARSPVTVSWITAGMRRELLSQSIVAAKRIGFDGHGGLDPGSSFVVFDDSPEQRARHALAEMEVPIQYVGVEETRKLAALLTPTLDADEQRAAWAALATTGVHTDITTGANRNRWLLSIAGKTAISQDDDALLPYMRDRSIPFAGGVNSAPVLSSRHDPSRQSFFQDRNALEERLEKLDFGLSELVNSLDALGHHNIDYSKMGPDAARAATSGELRVVAASAGIVGDSGMSRAHLPLFLSEPDRSRLWEESPHNAGSFLTNRLLSRHVGETTLSTGRHFMAPQFAVDASAVLPPFPAMGRNEDGVFRVAMSLLHPCGLVAHLPFAVFHEPKSDIAPLPAPSQPFGPRISDYLLAALMEYEALRPAADCAAGAYQSVGLHLAGLAAMPADSFEQWCRWTWARVIAQRVRQGEELLRLHKNSPEIWAEVMEGHLEALESSIDNVAPEELTSTGSGATVAMGDDASSTSESLARVQRYLGEYGTILQAWPAVWRAARTIDLSEFATSL